jgi:glucose-6-phosphate 1-epimerase
MTEGVSHSTRHGLAVVEVNTPLASALVYLQGAHVAHFQPTSQEPVLWMSQHAVYAAGKALRGGVPICFPWFGNHAERKDAPAHGFARTRGWRYLGSTAGGNGAVRLALELTSDEQTWALWPHAFRAEYTITVGATLELELAVTATGDMGFSFEQALHSYFAVSDVRRCQVEGLAGASYLDKVTGEIRREAGEQIRIAGETDRVYTSDAACTVHDPSSARSLRIEKSGSGATVIWNPWLDKARKMSDFGDDEWPSMLCVESASVGASAVALAAAQTHRLVQRISVTKVERARLAP